MLRRAFGILAAATVLGGCASSAAWSYSPAPVTPAPPNAVASASPSATPATSSDGILGTIKLHAIEFAFHPSAITVSQPGRYSVELTNGGAIAHDVTFDDGTVISAAVGETNTGVVDVPAGGIGFQCSIPGHADAGMKGTINLQTALEGGEP